LNRHRRANRFAPARWLFIIIQNSDNFTSISLRDYRALRHSQNSTSLVGDNRHIGGHSRLDGGDGAGRIGKFYLTR